jgi:hypothetical protein
VPRQRQALNRLVAYFWLSGFGLENNAFCITLRDTEVIAMTTLSVTARGQVTFRKDVLHLGIQPGGKIRLDLLPDGRRNESGSAQGFVAELHRMLKGRATVPGSRSRKSTTLSRMRRGCWHRRSGR